jgi:hypothetical protein
MLRPTVSRPVYLGVKHPSGAYDQIFITVSRLRVCWCGALSLTRGRVCRLQLLPTSPAQSFLGPSPMELANLFYCLRFETSLFVASYDPQGYGGGIRPTLLFKVKVTLRLAVYHQSLCLGVKPLRLTTRVFSQLNPCDISPYVTSSLTRRWVCLLWICLAFRQVYISHTHTACYWKILAFALRTSLMSVQTLQSRSCLSYISYAATAL